MLDQLPDFIDPVVFAERQSHLVGRIGVQRFQRLADFLFNQEGELNVDLQFYKEGKVPVIEGNIQGDLALVCQKCLKSLSLSVDKAVKIGMVQTIEQADRLEEGFEPMIVKGERILLAAIVEDEILLSLPDYPKHESQCIEYKVSEILADPDESKQESDNPFSVLAQLKNIGDQ